MSRPAYDWVIEHSTYQGDWCLVFPFYRLPGGYGTFVEDGKTIYAHRMMCELVNGPPPSDEHEAAHECGYGDRGCCNPRHLKWKTHAENIADRTKHGTQARGERKVTQEMAAAILEMKGKVPRKEIAAEFGVSVSTVSDIFWGRTHGPNRRVNYWSQADDDKLREAIAKNYSFRQAAEIIGRPKEAVEGRAYRLGLRSNWNGPGGISLEERARRDAERGG